MTRSVLDDDLSIIHRIEKSPFTARAKDVLDGTADYTIETEDRRPPPNPLRDLPKSERMARKPTDLRPS